MTKLTLGIPGNSTTNFATTPIPSMVMDRGSADGPLSTRSELGWITVANRSNYGTAQISGPAYAPKYIWAVAAALTEVQARQLGAMARWQDTTYKAQGNGALRLIDEVEYLDDEPNPHSRTLLSALVTPWNGDYRYGYGVFPVVIQLPEDWRTQLGRWSTGGDARLVTFSLVEL